MIPLRTVVPLAALLLVACSGPRVNRGETSFLYSTSELFAAADGRDLRTVVQGNPFGTPGFEQGVAERMTATYVGPRTRFTTTPGPTARRDYFVSVVFNAQPEVNPLALCDQKPRPTAPAKRPIVVRAAFCVLGSAASRVSGYLDQATGPDDPNFIDLIRHVTIQLFPYTSPFSFERFADRVDRHDRPRAALKSAEPRRQRRVDRLRLFHRREMAAFLDHHQSSAGDQPGGFLRQMRRGDRILPAADDQGRAGDPRQIGPAVGPPDDRRLLPHESVTADAAGHRRHPSGQDRVLQPVGMQEQRQQPRRHPLELAGPGQGDQAPAAAGLLLAVRSGGGVDQGEPGHPLRRPAHDL